jgi:hypothetical protein
MVRLFEDSYRLLVHLNDSTIEDTCFQIEMRRLGEGIEVITEPPLTFNI